MSRALVRGARRVVVKVGSSSIATAAGGLDGARLGALADALALRCRQGVGVVLVSSGAIAAGLAPLGLTRRPRDLATLQAAASVGQSLLVGEYARAFKAHGLPVGQVLLTAEDVVRRAHYRNARTTLNRLLQLGVLPVVNENDTVATAEIRVGDNDRLAALVAHLVTADLLVLLSDVDALYDRPPGTSGARALSEVRSPEELMGVSTSGAGSPVGSGGMATKLDAAMVAAAGGAAVVLAAAADAAAALGGEEVGTLVHPTGRPAGTRLMWLAFASAPRGRLYLDAGAVAAVIGQRASLLAAGVTGVDGSFAAGDPVELCDPAGRAVARGLVGYSAAELPGLIGRQSADLPPQRRRALVHRDSLAPVCGSGGGPVRGR